MSQETRAASRSQSVRAALPADGGVLLGRVWDPIRALPVPVLIRGGAVFDLLGDAWTMSDLMERPDLHAVLEAASRRAPRWAVEELGWEGGDSPALLAPIDLQVIKACGVTFVGSMLERVIEERCQGDAGRAAAVREQLNTELGVDISTVTPGSALAAKVKETLVARGWWSQYLEVGIGPDPEVFTKGPVLSAVGSGSRIGIPKFSSWNNPEPELVLIVRSDGTLLGVTLGNDVNLRDVEGRSALLLGMAKDNNRSTAIGPVIRLFDSTFSLDDARSLEIGLGVFGSDGFELHGVNRVSALSRPFEELVSATVGEHHQYPDGFALFTGTLFAPTEDRDRVGAGFTHRMGDVVEIRADQLGLLQNVVAPTESLPAWDYGIRQLWSDLARVRTSASLPNES